MLTPPPAKPEPLKNTRFVAEYLDRPPRTLEQWRWLGIGPAYIKVGRSVRYRMSDVETWLASHSVAGDVA